MMLKEKNMKKRLKKIINKRMRLPTSEVILKSWKKWLGNTDKKLIEHRMK